MKKDYITVNQLLYSLDQQKIFGEMLGITMINLGYITHDQLADAMGDVKNIDGIQL